MPENLQPKGAISGILTNIRHIKTTGEMRLEITIAKEMANAAFDRLGGFPDPGQSRWVALAVLKDVS